MTTRQEVIAQVQAAFPEFKWNAIGIGLCPYYEEKPITLGVYLAADPDKFVIDLRYTYKGIDFDLRTTPRVGGTPEGLEPGTDITGAIESVRAILDLILKS